MPFFGSSDNSDYFAQSELKAKPMTEADRELGTAATGVDTRSFGESIAAGASLAAVDLVDTISSSAYLTDRGEVNEKFMGAIGSPGLTAFVNRNQGAVEATSGIAGIILADYVAGRITKPGSAVMKGLRAVPGVRRIAALDAQYNRAKRMAMLTQEEVARRGITGADRFLGGSMSVTMLGAPVTLNRAQTTSNLFRAGAAKMLTRNLATEGVMAATLRTNSFLYDDDFVHNLKWAALGLGVGQGFDTMAQAYTLRKMANSQAIRQLNRGAYDVSGFESQRLATADTAETLKAFGGMADNSFQWKGSGGVTDGITSTLIQASENSVWRGGSETAEVLSGKREQFATQLMTLAQEDLQKVTTRGLLGVNNSGFNLTAEGLGSPIKEALGVNPLAVHGVEELGTVPEGFTAITTDTLRKTQLEKRLAQVQTLLKDRGTVKRTFTKDKIPIDTLTPLTDDEVKALQQEARELTYRNSHVGFVMFEPGEKAPLSHAKMLEGYTPRTILTEGGVGKDNLAIWQLEKSADRSGRVGLDSNGEIYFPDGKSRIGQLDDHDILDLYKLGRKAVTHMKNAGGKLTIGEKANWFTLDLAERLIRETGDPDSVQFVGTMTRERAKVESFAQKVDEIKRKESRIRQMQMQGVAADISEADIFKLKVQYNLPRIDAREAGLLGTSETPVDLLLSGFKSGDEIRRASHQDLLQVMNEKRKIEAFTDQASDSLDSLSGRSFDFLMDQDGNAMKPIMGYMRPMNPLEWSRDDLFIRQAMKDVHVNESLSGTDADAFTKSIFKSMTQDPSSNLARKVMELADDQQRSFVPGFRNAAPQSTMGSLMNAVTSRARRDVDSPAMLAASNQKDIQTRVTQAMTKSIFEYELSPLITQVTSSQNAKSAMLLNQLHSFGHGWHYKVGTDKTGFVKRNLPDGKSGWAMVLDPESALNQKRFESMFGRALEKGDVLMNPNGQEIVLDELSRQVFEAQMKVHDVTRAANNTLLRAQNLPEIGYRWGYVNPPTAKGKYLQFTFDAAGKVVPDMTIRANSEAELAKMAAELRASPQWKSSYRLRSKDDVTEYMTLWDKAQMQWDAPNVTVLQPGKQSTGRLGGIQYDPRAFEDSLVMMRESLINHGSDVLDVIYDDVLKAARARSQIAKVESPAGGRSTDHSSIYDRYVQNLTGRSSLTAKDSFFGDVMKWGEDRINGFLNSPAAEKAGRAASVMSDWIRYAAPGKSASGEQFKRLSQELGEFMPFKSTADYLAKTQKSPLPRDVADITSKLSWFEASSRLRWFESMHAVVNIGSILANTPAVIRALQPRVGESIADAGARNSSLAMMLNVGDEATVAVPNTMKLLWQAAKHQMKSSGDPIIEQAAREAQTLGYMGQEVAEMHRAWGAIDSKAGWRGFMFGDETRQARDLSGPFKSARAKVAQSGGLDKWLGVLSDKSEDFSRAWGMHAGYIVGRSIGIDNPKALNQFAHEITNKLIANYDPRNRPEIFQGPLGAPIGLFQSYVFNYYQRLFRYAETGDYRSLATQMGMQSAVFGAGSVPGWDALNWAFFDHGQARGDDPVDTLYKRFDSSAADLIMHGTLSNLPKIVGMEGLNIYTRGDTAVRLPGSQWTTLETPIGSIPAPNLPTFDTIGRVYTGLTKGLGMAAGAIFGDKPIGLQQMAEVAANSITNRPIAGMIEQVAGGGYDTSGDGQLMARTSGFSQTLYRMLGVRSMLQQNQIDAFYQNKTYTEEQELRRSGLKEKTRGLIRSGKTDSMPQVFEQYVEDGGDPRYFTRWWKDTEESALKTRSELGLEKAMKDQSNRSGAMIQRYMDSQVDVAEGEEALDDYGSEAEQARQLQQQYSPVQEPESDFTSDFE